MNEQMKKDLETVINAVINEDSDEMVASFKSYLRDKTSQIFEAASSEKIDDGDAEIDDDDAE